MSVLPQRFKKNSLNKYRTKGLFWELANDEDKKFAYFTLETDDILVESGTRTMRSLRKLYIEIADPTEYYFALEVFGSWEHWEHIASAPWMAQKLGVMRRELEVKYKALSVKSLMKAATKDDTSSMSITASKYLIDKGWSALAGKVKSFKPAEVAAISKEVEEDLVRMGIK